MATVAQCSVDGCERRVHGRGLCGLHYQRFLKSGDPLKSRRYERIVDGQRCAIDGCGKPVIGRGWCANHYALWRKYGDPTHRSEWHRRRDEPIIDAHGYVLVYAPKHGNARKSSRVPEHRLVMSEHLGRPLLDDETVHHINGDKADNRLENLELWSGAHPKGQRVSDLVEFARIILDRYT